MAKGSFIKNILEKASSFLKTQNARDYDEDEENPVEPQEDDDSFFEDYKQQIDADSQKDEGYLFNPTSGYEDGDGFDYGFAQDIGESKPQPQQPFAGGHVYQMPTQPEPSKFRFAYMKVEKIEDTVAVADQILTGNTVVLVDLHENSEANARRITDFLDGVVYTCNARMELIADYTYVTVPENVALSGDFLSQVDTSSFTGGSR